MFPSSNSKGGWASIISYIVMAMIIPIVNGEAPYSLYVVNPPHMPPNNIIMVGLNYNQYHPTLMINNLIN